MSMDMSDEDKKALDNAGNQKFFKRGGGESESGGASEEDKQFSNRDIGREDVGLSGQSAKPGGSLLEKRLKENLKSEEEFDRALDRHRERQFGEGGRSERRGESGS